MPPMDVTIEKLIYGGDGLAHHDGSTVFIPFVLPAERVAAVPVEQKKKFVRARVEQLIEPSPRTHSAALPSFRRLRRLQLSAHSLRSSAAIQNRNSTRDVAAHRHESTGPARSKLMHRRPGAIAIARSGKFVLYRRRPLPAMGRIKRPRARPVKP